MCGGGGTNVLTSNDNTLRYQRSQNALAHAPQVTCSNSVCDVVESAAVVVVGARSLLTADAFSVVDAASKRKMMDCRRRGRRAMRNRISVDQTCGDAGDRGTVVLPRAAGRSPARRPATGALNPAEKWPQRTSHDGQVADLNDEMRVVGRRSVARWLLVSRHRSADVAVTWSIELKHEIFAPVTDACTHTHTRLSERRTNKIFICRAPDTRRWFHLSISL